MTENGGKNRRDKKKGKNRSQMVDAEAKNRKHEAKIC